MLVQLVIVTSEIILQKHMIAQFTSKNLQIHEISTFTFGVQRFIHKYIIHRLFVNLYFYPYNTFIQSILNCSTDIICRYHKKY